MNLVCLTILAAIACANGDSPRSAVEVARPVVVTARSTIAPALTPTLSIGRVADRRSNSSPWSACALDGFEAEEPDETWMLDLDLMAGRLPGWLGCAWTLCLDRAASDSAIPILCRSSYPLRC